MSSFFSFLSSPRTKETIQKDIDDTTTKLNGFKTELNDLPITPESTPAPAPATPQQGGRRRRTQKGKKSKKNKSRKSKR